jgi:hypothetical protein
MAEKTTALVHEGETFSVLKRQLIVNCELFEDNPTLLATPYRVRSPVSAAAQSRQFEMDKGKRKNVVPLM